MSYMSEQQVATANLLRTGQQRLSTGAQVQVDPKVAKKRAAIAAVDEYARMGARLEGSPINLTPLQPVVGTVAWNENGAGVVLAGQERRALVDQFGIAGGVSGVALNTRALASIVGGTIPNGQIILLHSFGVHIIDTDAVQYTGQAALDILQNISIQLDLRGTRVRLGAPLDWSDVLGGSGSQQNGRGTLGRRTVAFPSVMEPEDIIEVIATTERDIGGIVIGNQLTIKFHLRATRIYDTRVLGLS